MNQTLKNQAVKILVGRAAGIGLAAALAALEKGGLPHDTKGVLALAGIALAAVIAKCPDLFAAAGIIRPLSPGQESLYQQAVNGVTTLIQTPAARRKQKAEDMARQGLQDALNDPKTRDFLRTQLWQPGQPVPAGAQAPPAAEAAVAAPAAPQTASTDPAITATGGNQ